MAIYTNSRYQYSKVDYLTTVENGTPKPIVFYTPDDHKNTTYAIHNYAEGESLFGLSWRYYGRPDFWWAIVEYNPQVADFFNIAAGTPLRIPRA